jgi:plasmid stability protein
MSSLTIELTDDQKAALAAKARAHGLLPEEYARQLLQRALAPEWLRESWGRAEEAGLDQLSMEEIDAEIAAARRARREAGPHPDA